MLNVYGLVVVPSEPALKITETNNQKPGAFLSFVLVSLDDKKIPHRYQANLWVPESEVEEWRSKIEPGNVFHITNGKWQMREYEGGKFPIPQLNLDRYNFKKMKEPMWTETKKEE
jgi:hypothetical protein